MNFSELNLDQLKIVVDKRMKEIRNEKLFIHSKIDFWLNKIEAELISSNEIRQKKKELIDLGKFIYCFCQSIDINDALCESPDFLISYENRTIGIELTDLVIRDEEKKKEGMLKKLFNQIEIELRAEPFDYKGIYRVNFVDSSKFDLKTQTEIKSEIINLIKGKINLSDIVKIEKTYHTDVSIYHSEASIVGSLSRITVENRIRKKEKKILTYASGNFKEIWLLLVIGGLQTSEDYSFIEKEVTNIPFSTRFDKIFVLNFFKSHVFELVTYTS
jgi:hypothetical protein